MVASGSGMEATVMVQLSQKLVVHVAQGATSIAVQILSDSGVGTCDDIFEGKKWVKRSAWRLMELPLRTT